MTHFVRKALLRYIIDFLFFREFHAMENAFSKIETSCVFRDYQFIYPR